MVLLITGKSMKNYSLEYYYNSLFNNNYNFTVLMQQLRVQDLVDL